MQMKSLAFKVFLSRQPIVEKGLAFAGSYNSRHQRPAQLMGS
jgi:hypothetical protein